MITLSSFVKNMYYTNNGNMALITTKDAQNHKETCANKETFIVPQ